ncbi:MAG TPA: SGNH/GDSL hydrolase family protein [Armatimonadota bacterium]|jgi:lysophospholipase L1-like esterase
MHHLLFARTALLLACAGLGLAAFAAKSEKGNVMYPQLVDVCQRMAAGKHVTVAYLGGSITWGATATDPMKTSYRALTTKYLETAYPNAHITAVDAAIGGTGSALGVFRMDRDVLPYQPDLTFVEFAVNDSGDPNTQETMEGIVRKLRTANPNMAIVILNIGAGYDYKVTPASFKHQELAAHYGLPLIDIGTQVQDKVKNKELDGHAILTDGCHPNDNGYRIYTSIIVDELNRLLLVKGTAITALAAPMTPNRYETAAMLELSTLPALSSDWKRDTPAVVGTWFDHTPSRWMSSVIVATKDNATLTFDLNCKGVGLYYEIMKGGSLLHLSATGLKPMDIASKMDLDYGRVSYQFQLGDTLQKRTITLTADSKNTARVAYLFYTK